MKQKYELHAICKSPKNNSINQIQQCLEEGVDINLINSEGETALICAIKANSVDIVLFLLKNKANPNLSTPYVFPPLVWAVIMDSIELTATLLEHPEVEVNQHQKFQLTALYAATQIGNAKITTLLIDSGAIPIDALVNKQYQSPLCSAIHNRHWSIAEKLIHSFPELVNKPSGLGTYPLHQAAQDGLIYMVDVLIENSADIHAYLQDKATALYLAAQNGHDEVVLKLLQKGANYKQIGKKDSHGDLVMPLHIAGIYGHDKVVELLLKYPHTGYDLTRALHYVSSEIMKCEDFKTRQKIYTCSELIKNELAKSPDKREQSCLINNKKTKPPTFNYKFNNDNHYVVIDHPLTKETQNILGQLLLSFPHCSSKDWLQKFSSLKFELFNKELLHIAANAYDYNGNTVLGVACEYGKSLEAVQKLIDLGANLNTKDHNMGKLALHWAIGNRLSCQNKDSYQAALIVKCLLDNGAKTHITCYQNSTPLEYAQRRGFTAAESLIQALDLPFITAAIVGFFKVAFFPQDMAGYLSTFFNRHDGVQIASTCKEAYNSAFKYM